MQDLEEPAEEPVGNLGAPSGAPDVVVPELDVPAKRSRRILIASAVVLAIILGLLIWLLLASGLGDRVTKPGSDPVSGIAAELVIEGPGTGDLPTFNKPMGAAFSRDGKRIYIADTGNNRVCIFERDGTFVSSFGGLGVAKPLEGAKATWSEGRLNYPVDIAIDREGLLYVADFYNDSISVFSAEGQFIRRFPDPHKIVGRGASGSGGTGIAVTSVYAEGDRIYATDSYQVLVFGREGELIMQFGRPGTAPGQFDRPGGIVVDQGGRITVADSNNNRVATFTPGGEVLWTTGDRRALEPGSTSSETTPTTTGGFVLPRGITLLDDGDLLVADPLAQELVRISATGTVVARYGRRGALPSELNFPNDVDWRDERVLITDRENNRVQIARLVGE